MQILRKRMPWRPYLIRLTALALIMAVVGTYAMMRYRIGIDTQQERCLPDTTVYLIDLWNKEPVKDGLYAFHSKGLAPLYNDGTRMLKRLTGMPGDEVKVTPEHVLVNGAEVSTGMALAQRLGVPVISLSTITIITPFRFWSCSICSWMAIAMLMVTWTLT